MVCSCKGKCIHDVRRSFRLATCISVTNKYIPVRTVLGCRRVPFYRAANTRYPVHARTYPVFVKCVISNESTERHVLAFVRACSMGLLLPEQTSGLSLICPCQVSIRSTSIDYSAFVLVSASSRGTRCCADQTCSSKGTLAFTKRHDPQRRGSVPLPAGNARPLPSAAGPRAAT